MTLGRRLALAACVALALQLCRSIACDPAPSPYPRTERDDAPHSDDSW